MTEGDLRYAANEANKHLTPRTCSQLKSKMIDDAGLKQLIQEAITQDMKESDEYRTQSVEQFRGWIEKSPEIQNCRTDDTFLLTFLRHNKFSLLETQQLFLNYLKVREMFPQLFRNLDIDDPNIRRIITNGAIYNSPYKDEKGRGLFVARAGRVDPHSCTFQDIFRTTMLCFHVTCEHMSHQLLGAVAVIDMSGFSTAHVAMFPLLEMSTFVRLSKVMFPKSLKEAHIINLQPAVRGFVKFCMSGLSEKLRNKFFFHNTLDDLHNSLNVSLLPLELGGSMPEKTMIDTWVKELQSKRSIILSMDNMSYVGANEHSIQEPISSGVQGSFRKLNLD